MGPWPQLLVEIGKNWDGGPSRLADIAYVDEITELQRLVCNYAGHDRWPFSLSICLHTYVYVRTQAVIYHVSIILTVLVEEDSRGIVVDLELAVFVDGLDTHQVHVGDLNAHAK